MFAELLAVLAGRSSAWPKVRKQHLTAEPDCQACGKTKDPEVHHVLPFHLYPERELDRTNLITLCARCHLLVGHLDDWSAFNPSVRRDAAALRDAFTHKRTTRDDTVAA